MRALLVLLEFAWCGGLARSSRPSSLKVEEAAAAAFLVEVVVIDEAYNGLVKRVLKYGCVVLLLLEVVDVVGG